MYLSIPVCVWPPVRPLCVSVWMILFMNPWLSLLWASPCVKAVSTQVSCTMYIYVFMYLCMLHTFLCLYRYTPVFVCICVCLSVYLCCVYSVCLCQWTSWNMTVYLGLYVFVSKPCLCVHVSETIFKLHVCAWFFVCSEGRTEKLLLGPVMLLNYSMLLSNRSLGEHIV